LKRVEIEVPDETTDADEALGIPYFGMGFGRAF